ncbi:FMN-binding negative transcriptional regulator [Shewanella woodyi]|uniref:FMN-binding negative transcriptional regulator n=1 Tax=Shewanella woodyi (strain ATCC 51908 / MS32) TaxID=392500 RepID=B1KPV7_SHEWM|nr:FMN-binding negative transcriptional regulator [Shewanella woodyi]ACA87640.1 FMN-binding negative transcriptional regulator [Shewanella woodyi ATCC 51908]
MHIPKTMKIESRELIHQFIEAFSFGAIISEQLEANHLPFLLQRSEGELGTLYGHFSRANQHLATQDGCTVMVILQGPHSYISPTWYVSSPAVPTWNYAAVHIHGEMKLLPVADTIKILDETVRAYEPELLNTGETLTDEYRDRLVKGVIGFKINITQMLGKQKLGQNRKPADQLGVVNGLKIQSNTDAISLLNYMKKVGVGLGETNS